MKDLFILHVPRGVSGKYWSITRFQQLHTQAPQTHSEICSCWLSFLCSTACVSALIWLLNCYPIGPNSIKGTPSPFSLFYKQAPSAEPIKNPPEDKPDWSPLLSQSLMNSGKRLPRLITQLSGNQYQIYGGKNNLIHFLSVLFIAYFFLSIYHF